MAQVEQQYEATAMDQDQQEGEEMEVRGVAWREVKCTAVAFGMSFGGTSFSFSL